LRTGYLKSQMTGNPFALSGAGTLWILKGRK
jgi:hypothetical protein